MLTSPQEAYVLFTSVRSALSLLLYLDNALYLTLGCYAFRLGITLKRLGLRMYIVCCTNNIIAQGSSGGKDNPRFGDEVVGVDGQSIGLMTAAAVEALIEHGMQQRTSSQVHHIIWPPLQTKPLSHPQPFTRQGNAC
jgi:hypothetical protein